MEQTLTQGKPYRQILRFTIPLLLGNLFQQFYNMADAFIISRTLGVEAFAGVSSTGGISFLILGFAQGMTAGLAILISKSFGARDYNGMKKHYYHNMLICLAMTIVLTVISLAGTDLLLTLLRTPADIFDYARQYLQVLFAGIAASMLYNFLANTQRAMGNSRSPLVYLLIASALNIILDIIFIRFTPMGVRGAALATVLSQGVSALLCLFKIRKSISALSLKNYREGFQISAALGNLRLGLPMAFQSSIIALGVIVMQFATNGMGTIAVASYAAASKIDGIAVEPLRSLGMTMTTYTAQNNGSNDSRRILDGVRQCIILSLGLSLALGLLMFLGGGLLTRLFIGSGQPQVLAQSHTFLMIHGALYMILALLFVFRYTLQGLGYTFIPTLAGFMELMMRVLAALVLVPQFQFIGASITTPLSWLGALIPVAIAYHHAVKNMQFQLKDLAGLNAS